MKKTLLLPVIAIASFSMPSVATANSYAQSLCEYVSIDDKKRLRSFLKSNKLKIRNVYESVQCNGQTLLEFASAKNSVKTGTLMINKLPKKVVSTNIAKITSVELAAVANKRVNS